jgi:hypothetical protein
MKQLFITILLLAIAGMAVAKDCAGYYESFDIRVLDAKIRSVEGALVQVKFDRGTSFGPQYFTTEPTPTDSDGKIHISIHNQGTNTREIDCSIYINATAGGLVAKKTIVVDEHGPLVDLMMDIYKLDVYVKNQDRKPVENATITINSDSKKTDSRGLVRFYSKTGEVEYLASYLKGKQSGIIPVSDDTTYEIILPQYSVSIDVIDDQGNPLRSTLELFGETYELEDGHYETDEVFGDEITATITYAGIVKEIDIYPAVENEVVFVFDVHPPLIETIDRTVINNRPRLTVRITDQGEYGSGVNPQSVSVSYRIVGETSWATATTYATGTNTYTVDFPVLQRGKIIEFRIEALDEQGNKALQTGRFVTAEEPEDNATENGEKPQENGEEEQEIPLFYIVIGVILISLVLYIVKHFKR